MDVKSRAHPAVLHQRGGDRRPRVDRVESGQCLGRVRPGVAGRIGDEQRHPSAQGGKHLGPEPGEIVGALAGRDCAIGPVALGGEVARRLFHLAITYPVGAQVAPKRLLGRLNDGAWDRQGSQTVAQIQQEPVTPFTEDAVCNVVRLGEHPHDTAVLASDGREAVIPVGLVHPAVALDGQELVEGGEALPSSHDFCKLWADDPPDVAPDFGCRPTQRPRMPIRWNRDPGIVVEVQKLGTPVDCGRKGRVQADRKRCTQRRWPLLGAPE
jgi:hypothetical protein